jgi:tetratricopeptide (TPR) repeat protein
MDFRVATPGASVARAVLARCYLEQACCFEKVGDLESALRSCLSAIGIAPSLAEAHNYQGLLLEGLELRLEALESYRKALRLDPGCRDAAQNLAQLEAKLAGPCSG